jgi:hypothetical protein
MKRCVAVLFAIGCGGAPAERLDLTGVWEGTYLAEEQQARLIVELADSTSGTWRFVDEQGEGAAGVLDDRLRTVRIRLSQRTPCMGTFTVDALLADDELLEGTLDGSDCNRTLSSGLQLRRGP